MLCVHTHLCTGQRPGVFLNFPSSYFLRQCLALNRELINGLDRLAKELWRSSYLYPCPQPLRLQTYEQEYPYMGTGNLESGSQTWVTVGTVPIELFPQTLGGDFGC